MKIEIVFVILHYLVHKDTIECVDSIMTNMGNSNYKIIIVDNASSNDSGKILEKKYKEIPEVVVILNNENLGFARGNNVGFLYAKKQFHADFIVLMNNDTLLLQPDFYSKIKEEYDRSHFALLGPMILTADGRCDCTPVSSELLTRETIANRLRYEERRTALINLGLVNPLAPIKNVLHALKTVKMSVHKDYIHRQENIRIHGCFLIFSKEFIDRFDGLYENTFLYHEEEILFVQLMGEKLKIVYLPTIQIYHKEDAATNAVGRKKKEAKKFIYNCSVESCRELLKVYEQYNS